MSADKRWWPAKFDSYFSPPGVKPASIQKTSSSFSATQLSSGLGPFESTLSLEDTKHLLRRVQSGARADVVESLEGRNASEVIDELVDAAMSAPLPEPPEWHDSYLPEEGSPEEEV